MSTRQLINLSIQLDMIVRLMIDPNDNDNDKNVLGPSHTN